jgi:hypothetical protein
MYRRLYGMSQCQRHNPARNNRGLLVDQEDLYDEEEVLDCGKAVNFTYYDHLGKWPRKTFANLNYLLLNFGYHIYLFFSNISSFIRDQFVLMCILVLIERIHIFEFCSISYIQMKHRTVVG